ncbi:transcription elongation factor Spt5 protein [Spatholobus suberectus]|nr:transcription elongation factor Spt5 protein [Spatholobus suberectus]
MKVQMKILMELVVGTGEVVTRVEVAQTEVALEVEVFGVEESVGALVAGESVEALVAEENEEALMVEVDQTGKVLVVDGDQMEDVEAEAGEGVLSLVVGTTEGILGRMGPLTGRRVRIMLKDGRTVMDLRLGTRILVARTGRAGARAMHDKEHPSWNHGGGSNKQWQGWSSASGGDNNNWNSNGAKSGGWNNGRDSGEGGSSDWKKGADNVEGSKNSSGSEVWNHDIGDKDRQSWSQGNADKERPSWNQGGGSNKQWQSWGSASGGGNDNWNSNGSRQTAQAVHGSSWKKSTTEETNVQDGGWNKGSSSNTGDRALNWGQSSAAEKGQSSSWNESADGGSRFVGQEK